MRLVCFFSFLLCAAGIVLLLDLTPGRISENIQALLSPELSLRERTLLLSGRKKQAKLPAAVLHVRDALEQTGRVGRFGGVCAAALGIGIFGTVLGAAAQAYYLIPISLTGGVFLPFFAAERAVELYDSRMHRELETALSVVTAAYLRSGNIVGAVRESLPNLRAPVEPVFREFYVNATAISSDLAGCVKRMQNSVQNRVFRDWCEVLLACLEDSSNRDALLPVVTELSELRLANSEMVTAINECRKEYYGMVILTLCNFPLIYFLNRDWWHALIGTAGGQTVTAICGVVLILTSFFMVRLTRPMTMPEQRRET